MDYEKLDAEMSGRGPNIGQSGSSSNHSAGTVAAREPHSACPIKDPWTPAWAILETPMSNKANGCNGALNDMKAKRAA